MRRKATEPARKGGGLLIGLGVGGGVLLPAVVGVVAFVALWPYWQPDGKNSQVAQ